MGLERVFPDFDLYGGLSFYDHASGLRASPTFLEPPARSRGPVDDRLVFAIVFPQTFFLIKTEGPSRAMIFLYGRIMVLGELLMGYSKWGPSIPFAWIWLGSAW